MKTIWKFTVPVAHSQEINIKGASFVEFLSADISGTYEGDQLTHEIVLWAIVDEDPQIWSSTVRVEMRGTGAPLHNDRLHSFIGTVRDGIFVWHIFRGSMDDE